VICSCYQCDSAFCALQLTTLIKPSWCVLLRCCACLHPNTILMEAGLTTVPCPATNFSVLICKPSARTKQSVISVALKTPPEIRLGICIYKTSLLHRSDDYIGFTPSCPPHILQQNCAHARKQPCSNTYVCRYRSCIISSTAFANFVHLNKPKLTKHQIKWGDFLSWATCKWPSASWFWISSI